jgi:hypothetical protein
LGLYLLIPLAISEFLFTIPSLSGTREQPEPKQDQLKDIYEEPPQEVPDDIVFGDR